MQLRRGDAESGHDERHRRRRSLVKAPSDGYEFVRCLKKFSRVERGDAGENGKVRGLTVDRRGKVDKLTKLQKQARD